MILSSNYEIIEIADEYLAVPVGEMAKRKKDVYSFSKAAAFLLNKMKKDISKQDLIDSLLSDYDIDLSTAQKDVEVFISTLLEYEIIDL